MMQSRGRPQLGGFSNGVGRDGGRCGGTKPLDVGVEMHFMEERRGGDEKRKE